MQSSPLVRSLRQTLLLLVGTVSLLLSLILIINSRMRPDQYTTLRGSGTVYRLREEELLIRELPPIGMGQAYSYSFLCPQIEPEDECLAVNLSHQFARITIDGIPVYSSAPSDDFHLGASPGFYWALVPLREEDVGKEICILVDDVYSGSSWLPLIVIADKGDLILSAFRTRWVAISVCLLCIATGLLYMLSPLYMHLERRERLCLFYLGAFTALFGLYRLVDFPIAALYVSLSGANPRFLSTIALLGYMLVPLPLDLFFSWVYPEKPVYKTLCLGIALLILPCLILQLLGRVDLRELLPYVSVCHFLNILIVMILSVWGIFHDRAGARPDPMRILYLAMGLSSLFDLCIYYWKGSQTVEVTLYVVLLHAIIRGISGIRKAHRQWAKLQQLRAEMAEQRIKLLMSQIKPHFIYNTLNTVYSLCDLDPDTAKTVVHDFSQYLRMNTAALEQTTPIPFLRELEHTRCYLSIEQTRFPDRFQIVYDLGCDSFRLPALSLQPLVENAVRHGLLHRESPGVLEIQTRDEGSAYVVTVKDNGVGFAPDQTPVSREEQHIGLNNVRKRVEQMCSGTLSIQSRPGEGTTARIILPKEAQKLDDPDR